MILDLRKDRTLTNEEGRAFLGKEGLVKELQGYIDFFTDDEKFDAKYDEYLESGKPMIIYDIERVGSCFCVTPSNMAVLYGITVEEAEDILDEVLSFSGNSKITLNKIKATFDQKVSK